MKRLSAKKILIIAAAIVVALIILIAACSATVPTGYTAIVTTFGRVEDMTLEAGFHLKSPVQEIVLMDNREQKTSFSTQAFSSDIQQVDINGSINYSINKSTAMNLFKEVGTDYFNKLVSPRMLEITKGVFSKYTAENLVAYRQSLSDQICTDLSSELDKYGINVISISIENIDFTDAFTDAVEAKQVAAQKKLQAEIEQSQKTMETEQQASREKIAAQAAADVAKINADADAYSVKVRAEAEADANKKVAESLTDELIRYTQAQTWDGGLPMYVAGGDATTLPIISMTAPETEVLSGDAGNE